MFIYFIWCDIVIVASVSPERRVDEPAQWQKWPSDIRPFATNEVERFTKDHTLQRGMCWFKPKMMVSQVVVASESLLELDIWKEKENPNNPRFNVFMFHSCRSRRLFTCQALQGSGGWCFWMWWHLTWQEVSCKHVYRSFFCGFLGPYQFFKQPNSIFFLQKRVVPPPKWHLWLSWIICRL